MITTKQPLPGLMQHHPLRIGTVLSHAARAHPHREIFSRQIGGPDWRGTYTQFAGRVARAAHALAALGVGPGDRVATLAWNTIGHLDLFYAVPGLGAVLMTANPRLFEAQIAYTITHAGAEWLLFDPNLLDLVERLAPLLPHVKHYVMLSDDPHHLPGTLDALCFDTLTAAQPSDYEWLSGDENDAAVLCYTSGTTGAPKGVLYSHRSIVLHAMGVSCMGVLAMSAFDVVMPCSSLYHATGWGLPYIALMHGAKLVLPGDRLTPENLHDLVQTEGVTFSVGVPTIWTAYIAHVEAQGSDTGPLTRLLIGGAATPAALALKLKKYGVFALQAWGMTEMSPIGTASTPSPAAMAAHGEHIDEYLRERQGRGLFGVEVRVVGEDGTPLPADGRSAGAVQARGPWVVRRYYRAEADAVDAEGWFDTGDIAAIDQTGFLRMTDRAKDVIKSGGEWISSIEVENVAAGYPGVALAAVVGIAHPRWDERPLLVIQPEAGVVIDPGALIEALAPHMARWWLPERIVFAEVPLTSTGKIDKKLLRLRYANAFASGASDGAGKDLPG